MKREKKNKGREMHLRYRLLDENASERAHSWMELMTSFMKRFDTGGSTSCFVSVRDVDDSDYVSVRVKVTMYRSDHSIFIQKEFSFMENNDATGSVTPVLLCLASDLTRMM